MIRHRFRAQALVEFSLVIVLLLMIIIGVIEAGRVLFIYASVITASRESTRYGSVPGYNDAGVLHYQDCAGIRTAAKKVSFFAGVEDSNIVIKYDSGPGTSIFDTCDNSVDTNVNLVSGDRVLVTVTASYRPILTLIPFTARNISFSTARTIIGVVQYDNP